MFNLKSEGIINGYILDRYGKFSENLKDNVPQESIPLSWENAPDGTVSYAVVFQDYDNIPDEGFSWIHWLVADIPHNVTGLKADQSRQDKNLIQGKNSWMTSLGNYGLPDDITNFYGGPAPNKPHEYEVRIFALDQFLSLKNGFFYNELLKAMEGHILAEAVLKGIYKV